MAEAPMSPRKLLIADDHAHVRRSLRQMLEDIPELYVGGEACDGEETLTRIRTEAWDLVILDITMPRKNGFDVLKALHNDYPGLPVLVLSVHPATQYMRRVLELGAAAYIMKDEAPEKLLPAIREIFANLG